MIKLVKPLLVIRLISIRLIVDQKKVFYSKRQIECEEKRIWHVLALICSMLFYAGLLILLILLI